MVRHWREIVGDFEKPLIDMLIDYRKSTEYRESGWGAWVDKHIKTQEIRDRLERTLQECRENGWYAPEVRFDHVMGQRVAGLSFGRVGTLEEHQAKYKADQQEGWQHGD